MQIFRLVLILTTLLTTTNLLAQSLRINEISQGATGSKEYVELLVTGPMVSSCNEVPPCVDIRGWILDDNNGYFSNGNLSGTGVAVGAIRFSNNNFWSCMKPGTIIVIYNNDDLNPNLPPQDQNSNDENCTLVIPISSNLFERHESSPSSSSMSYATSGWISGGKWEQIAMANGGDSFQIYTANNTSTPVHAVSWGNNSTNNIIYFSGSAGGLVFSCLNNINSDHSLQTNWMSASASTDESPGFSNSNENSTLISGLNFNCGSPLIVTVNTINESCLENCDGSATVNITGGHSPYQSPIWSNGSVSHQINNLCNGNYSVEIIDANGCSSTKSFEISSGSTNTLTTSGDTLICLGETITISAFGATNYTWNNGLGNNNSITVSPIETTIYQVTTSTGNCTTQQEITISVINCNPDITDSYIELANVFSPNGDNFNDLYVPIRQENIQIKNFVILNRWGNIIHENNTQISWNGKDQTDKEVSDGVYFYKLLYSNQQEETKTLHGFIHVIRK